MKSTPITIAALTALLATAAHAADAPLALSCKKDAQDATWAAFETMMNGHGLAELQPAIAKATAADPACAAAQYFAASWSMAPDAEKKMADVVAGTTKLPEAERSFFATLDAEHKGDTAAMLKSAQKLSELTPKSWLGPLEVSLAQRMEGKMDDSLASAKKATELGPTLGLTWNQLAYANVFLKKNDDAIVALKKYSEVAPKEANAHDTLGDVLLAVGKLDEAEAEYKKAVDVSGGTFAISNNGAAGVHFMKGDFDGGRTLVAKWRTDEPDAQAKIDADFWTAWSYVAQGKADDAMKAFDAIDKAAPAAKAFYAAAEAPLSRAEALYELEKYADAQKALDVAAKADLSKTSPGFQQGQRMRRAALAVAIAAKSGKTADAEKGLAAVDTEAKGDVSNTGLQDRARVAHGEVLLAKKDAKGAVAAMKDCQMEMTYCQYRLAVAEDAAGDAKAATATRALIQTPAFRDIWYVYARMKASKK